MATRFRGVDGACDVVLELFSCVVVGGAKVNKGCYEGRVTCLPENFVTLFY